LNNDILSHKLIDLVNVIETEKDLQAEREDNYRKSVISAFFEYGKLKSIPVQQKKRSIVLEEIAKLFERGKNYPEREVNIIIADIYDDFCAVRREMVDAKIFERENNVYKLVDKG
jgi:hypothetical protein